MVSPKDVYKLRTRGRANGDGRSERQRFRQLSQLFFPLIPAHSPAHSGALSDGEHGPSSGSPFRQGGSRCWRNRGLVRLRKEADVEPGTSFSEADGVRFGGVHRLHSAMEAHDEGQA